MREKDDFLGSRYQWHKWHLKVGNILWSVKPMLNLSVDWCQVFRIDFIFQPVNSMKHDYVTPLKFLWVLLRLNVPCLLICFHSIRGLWTFTHTAYKSMPTYSYCYFYHYSISPTNFIYPFTMVSWSSCSN